MRAQVGRSSSSALRLCARQTREGVRSIAHGPAHPVDGSRPRSRARRTFLNGESGGPRAGVPTYPHAHARVATPDMRMHRLDDVRLLCSAGLASGDAADTAAYTVGPSRIVIACKLAAVAVCHASFGHHGCSCAGAGGTTGTRLCLILRMFSCVGRWRLQWVSVRTCCTDGKGWRAC